MALVNLDEIQTQCDEFFNVSKKVGNYLLILVGSRGMVYKKVFSQNDICTSFYNRRLLQRPKIKNELR